jgi:tetratricopeptide (TPR) repeat protein
LLAQEAERWARRSGKKYVLALALNARALVEEYDGRAADALQYADRALKIAEGLSASHVRGMIYLTRARAHRHLFLTGEKQDRESRVLEEALKEANQAVNLLKTSPPDRVAALIERGCMHREIARVHYLQNGAAQAVKAARKSQEDLARAGRLAGALGLLDKQALAWTNLGWLWYYTGQLDEAQEALQQAFSSIPPDYFFPRQGPLPPMAREERKQEASLPFWSTLGKAEMLQAFIALDRASMALDQDEREVALKQAAMHTTLSLAYNEQVAGEYFVTRAEEGLHTRILQDNLGIGGLHLYASQVAKEWGLEEPTRFQKFLTRMFGPGDLWS